ncbi:MAG: M3 family oligoendopeptidase [Clostridia bacterium]|nr:M3 family oligoendopeptidase [Clostridia bacterium]
MTWDLSILYKGFDDPALRADIDSLKSLIASGNALLDREAPAAQKLEDVVTLQEELSTVFGRIRLFLHLTIAADNTHAEALRLMDELSLVGVDMRLLDSRCTRYIGSLENLEELIAASERLQANDFFLREAAEESRHQLPAHMEKELLRMSLNGADAWAKLKDRLMGTLTCEINGEQLPLPAVRGMAYDPDPAVRKAAYEAEVESYKKVDTAMAYCLGCIKGETITLCELKGYDDPLSMTLAQNRMDHATLNAMWTAIREALPDFRRYMRRKAELLGHQNGLPFYDLFAPMGESSKTYTIEEARELLVKTFNEINPEMGAFIDNAFQQRWIDVYPRKGKSGGAFCSGSYEKNVSRILTNFMGSFSDVCTLAHELGHAWHNRCLQRKPQLMGHYPMPLAETASIFNETLLTHVVRKNADESTRLTLLESVLQDATQTIVDIYSRFLFESKVFEARKTHIPSAAECNQMMLDAQMEAYGDGMDPDLRHSGMWVCKGHYYYTGRHFYNFPYAFGHLFGLGVFKKYLEEGAAFMPKYDALLASCGSDTIPNVCASVGIDVRSVDYWRSALDVLRAEVDEFIRLTDK